MSKIEEIVHTFHNNKKTNLKLGTQLQKSESWLWRSDFSLFRNLQNKCSQLTFPT